MVSRKEKLFITLMFVSIQDQHTKMKQYLSLFLFLSLSTIIMAQEKSVEELVNKYKSQVATAKVITDCGHAFDGPAYFLKQMENNSLDHMLHLTQKQKAQIGKNNLQQLKKKYKILKNHPEHKKVNQVFESVLKFSETKNTRFSLHIIDGKEINAFTTIGGYVYITTGLLNFISSYDELAFIMGHEIGHQDKRHMERKITKMSIASNLLGFTGIEGFTKIATNINATLAAPFDQMDEYEADKHGVHLAQKAGYDPTKFADFFKKLEKLENKNLWKKLSSTHPFAEHRKKCLQGYTNN